MNYFLQKIKQNYKAGITVALINIPLSISLAVASGATPTQGIITAIWSGIFAFLFASSNYNVFGVAGALSSILLSFVLTSGSAGVALLPYIAIFSGIIMLAIYFFKITKYITLIPSTVLHGFLISVGVTIALSQISGALGLNNPVLNIPVHKEIVLNLYEIIKNILQTNLYSFGVFLAGLIFLIITKVYFKKIPGVIILTLVGIGIGILSSKGILPETLLLIDKFPNINFALYQNIFKDFNSILDFSIMREVLKVSFIVSIIAIIETIISAKIAQKITKDKFSKDKEVLGLALANIGSGIFGGLPNTAVFIRTALNINSKATHKTAGLLISIFTLIISAVFFNGFFKYLPFPIISAILFNIAIGLIDINMLKKLYHMEKGGFFITIITIIICVVEDSTLGILIGIILTLFVYLGKVINSDLTINLFRKNEFIEKTSLTNYVEKQQENDTLVFKFYGGLNYLNIENYISQIEKLNKNQRILISFEHIINIDVDGIEAIDDMISFLKTNNISVYLIGKSDQTYIDKLHSFNEIKEKNRYFPSISQCLEVMKQKA